MRVVYDRECLIAGRCGAADTDRPGGGPLSVIPPERRRRYDAYARWVRTGKWSPDELWWRLVVQLVEQGAPEGRLALLLDDTLVNKSGRKVDGAGYFHDAVTSTAVAHKVTAWGLNVVILALRVPSPWAASRWRCR
jgi:hypothetical protein